MGARAIAIAVLVAAGPAAAERRSPLGDAPVLIGRSTNEGRLEASVHGTAPAGVQLRATLYLTERFGARVDSRLGDGGAIASLHQDILAGKVLLFGHAYLRVDGLVALGGGWTRGAPAGAADALVRFYPGDFLSIDVGARYLVIAERDPTSAAARGVVAPGSDRALPPELRFEIGVGVWLPFERTRAPRPDY